MYPALKFIQEHPNCCLSENNGILNPLMREQPMLSFGFYNGRYSLFSLCFEIELVMVFKIHSANPKESACEPFIPNIDSQIWPGPN